MTHQPDAASGSQARLSPLVGSALVIDEGVGSVIRRLLLSLACLGAASAVVPGAFAHLSVTSGASSATSRVALPEAVPLWILDYTDDGAAPASLVIRFRLYLSGRAPRAELRFATAVSRPGSKLFRRYLSPHQFEQKFAPSATQVSQVDAWASANGLKVTGSNQHFVSLSGSAPAISKALDTTIDGFGGTGAHPNGYAPVSSISVPASIASDVVTAVGLDNYNFSAGADRTGGAALDRQRARRADNSFLDRQRASRAGSSFPCSSWWGERQTDIPKAYGRTSAPTADCGYTPNQLRSAARGSAPLDAPHLLRGRLLLVARHLRRHLDVLAHPMIANRQCHLVRRLHDHHQDLEHPGDRAGQ